MADLQKVRAAAQRALELVDETFPPGGEAGAAGRLPRARRRPAPAQAEREPAALPPLRPPSEPIEPGSVSLLVVDDNELNRDMLSRRLGSRGFKVAVAEDGASALAMIEKQDFDLVLLDVMMPGLSGIDVLKRLRERWPESDLPVVMATARDATEDVVEALRLGANDYVTKPLDFAVVLARVETQLSLRRQKQEIRRLAENLELRNRFIQSLFGRYLSDEVVADLLASPEGPRIGGEQRRVTLLMSDLRGFTPLTEGLAPQQVLRLLNSYLGTMADVVLAHQGTVDEFVGDAILAIFGAPVARPDDARARGRLRRGDAGGARRAQPRQRARRPAAAGDGHRRPHRRGDRRQHRLRAAHEVRGRRQRGQPRRAHRVLHRRRPGADLRRDAARGGRRRAGGGAPRGRRQGHARADRRLRPARRGRRATCPARPTACCRWRFRSTCCATWWWASACSPRRSAAGWWSCRCAAARC